MKKSKTMNRLINKLSLGWDQLCLFNFEETTLPVKPTMIKRKRPMLSFSGLLTESSNVCKTRLWAKTKCHFDEDATLAAWEKQAFSPKDVYPMEPACTYSYYNNTAFPKGAVMAIFWTNFLNCPACQWEAFFSPLKKMLSRHDSWPLDVEIQHGERRVGTPAHISLFTARAASLTLQYLYLHGPVWLHRG